MNVAGAPNATPSVNAVQLGQAVDVQLMELANQLTTQQGQDIASMLEQSVRPYLGANLDIRV